MSEQKVDAESTQASEEARKGRAAEAAYPADMSQKNKKFQSHARAGAPIAANEPALGGTL